MRLFRICSRRLCWPALLLWFGMLGGCSSLPELPELPDFPRMPWEDGPEAAATPKPPSAPTIQPEERGIDAAMVPSVVAQTSIQGKPCDISEGYFARISADLAQQVKSAMQAFGYYEADVSVTRTFESPCPLVALDITPGEPVMVTQVSVEIAGPARADPAFIKLLANLPIKQGQRLLHADYARAKSSLLSLASARGYFEARYTHAELRVAPAERTAEVLWNFAGGERFGFGALMVEQDAAHDPLSDDLIRRILEYAPGQPYSMDEVAAMNRALLQSDYFASADVRPDLRGAHDLEVPITATIKLTERHHFKTTAGLSTDEGPRLKATYTNRRMNADGDRGSASVDFSLLRQSLNFAYAIPREHPRQEWLTLQTGVTREDTDTARSTELQFSTSDSKIRPWGWMETRYIERNRTSFVVGEDEDVSSFFVFGTQWMKTVSDDPLYPTRGWSLSAEARSAAETLLSDTSFMQLDLVGRAVYGLPWGARMLFRSELGTTFTSDFSALPPGERFFTGGDDSVRGYVYQSLGSVGSDGRVVGGSKLVVGSLEFEQPVYGAFGLAVFYDTGNAFGGPGQNQGFRSAIGIGPRWHSPVGPIRVDFARPLDGDANFMIHLRLGPDL